MTFEDGYISDSEGSLYEEIIFPPRPPEKPKIIQDEVSGTVFESIPSNYEHDNLVTEHNNLNDDLIEELLPEQIPEDTAMGNEDQYINHDLGTPTEIIISEVQSEPLESSAENASTSVQFEIPEPPLLSQPSHEVLNTTAIISARTGRHLRQRTVLQLHPYTLEYQQYKTTLKSRGVRPIRVSNSHDNLEPNSLESQSQIPAQSQLSINEHEVNNIPSSDMEDSNYEEGPVLFDSDIELRDGSMRDGSFSSPPPSQSSLQLPRIPRNNLLFDSEDEEYEKLFSENDIQNKNNMHDDETDRILLAMSRPQKKVPSTSVSAGKPLSDKNPVYGSDSHSDSDSDSNSDTQLQVLKKKVRGILPPSFITLDYALQEHRHSKTNDRRRPALSNLDSKHIGIARKKKSKQLIPDTFYTTTYGELSNVPNELMLQSPISSSASPVSNTTTHTPSAFSPTSKHNIIHILSDEEGDDFQDLTQYSLESPILEELGDSDISDMEDDHIDRIIGQSKANQSQKKRLNQSTITAKSNAIKRRKQQHSTTSVQKRAPKYTAKSSTSTRTSSSYKTSGHTSMSIVDMVNNSKQRDNLPIFSLIAQRTALLKATEYRQDSYTHKYIHINDGDDSHPELKTLKRWKKGTLARRSNLGVNRQTQTTIKAPSTKRLPTAQRSGSKPAALKLAKLIKKKSRPELTVVSRGGSYYQSRGARFRTTILENPSGIFTIRRPMENHRYADDIHHQFPVPHPNRSITPMRSTTEYKNKKNIMRPPERRPEVQQEMNDSYYALSPPPEDLQASNRLTLDNESSDRSHPSRTPVKRCHAFDKNKFYSHYFDIQRFPHDIAFSNDTVVGRGLLASLFEQAEKPPFRDSVYLGNGIGLLQVRMKDGKQEVVNIEKVLPIFRTWFRKCLSLDLNTSASYSLDAYEFFMFALPVCTTSLQRESIEELSRFSLVLASDIIEIWSNPSARSLLKSDTHEFTKLTFLTASLNLILLRQLQTIMESDRTSLYSHSTALKNLGGKLIKVMVDNCLDEITITMRKHRSTLNRVISRSSYMIEVLYVTIYILDQSSTADDHFSFHDIASNVIEIPLNLCSPSDLEISERAWHAVFTFCAIYQLPGQYKKCNWDIVNSLSRPILASFDDPLQEKLATRYRRAFFIRCLNLINQWHWSGNLDGCILAYRFFAFKKFANLENTGRSELTGFLEGKSSFRETVFSDTVYDIFLKFLASTLHSLQSTNNDNYLRKFNGKITPLNGRLYPMSSELKISELEALANQYSLLLVQFKYCQQKNRPTIDQLRYFIVLDESHISARLLSLEAWSVITRLLLEEDENIDQSISWFNEIVESGLKDVEKTGGYRSYLERKLGDHNLVTYQKFFKRAIFSAASLLSDKSLVMRSQQWMNLLTTSCGKVLLTSRMPEPVISSILNLIKHYISSSEYCLINQLEMDSIDDEIFDNTSSINLASVTSQLAGNLRDKMLKSYFEFLENCFKPDCELTDSVILESVEVWVLMASFMVGYIREVKWEWFLFTIYSWDALCPSVRKDQFEPVLLSHIMTRSTSAFLQNQEKFLDRFLEYLVRANILYEFMYVNSFLYFAQDIPWIGGFTKVSKFDQTTMQFYRADFIKHILSGLILVDRKDANSHLTTLLKSAKEQYETLKGGEQGTSYGTFVNKVLQWVTDYFPSFRSDSLTWFRDLSNFELADPLAIEISSAKTWFRSDVNRLGIYLINFLDSSLMRDSGEKFEEVVNRVVREEISSNKTLTWSYFVNDFVSSLFSLIDTSPVVIFFIPTVLQTINKVLANEVDIIKPEDFDFNRYQTMFGEGLKFTEKKGVAFDSVNYWRIIYNLFDSMNIIIGAALEAENDEGIVNQKPDIVTEYFSFAIWLLCQMYNSEPDTEFPRFTTPPSILSANSQSLSKRLEASLSNFSWIGKGYSVTHSQGIRTSTLTFANHSYIESAELAILNFCELYFKAFSSHDDNMERSTSVEVEKFMGAIRDTPIERSVTSWFSQTTSITALPLSTMVDDIFIQLFCII